MSEMDDGQNGVFSKSSTASSGLSPNRPCRNKHFCFAFSLKIFTTLKSKKKSSVGKLSSCSTSSLIFFAAQFPSSSAQFIFFGRYLFFVYRGVYEIRRISIITHGCGKYRKQPKTYRMVFRYREYGSRPNIRQKIWQKRPKLDGAEYVYSQNKMAGVHLCRKIISRRSIWRPLLITVLSLWFVRFNLANQIHPWPVGRQ